MEHPLDKYRKIYSDIFQEMRRTEGSANKGKYILMYRLAYHSMPVVRFGNWFKYKDENGDYRLALNMQIDYKHPISGLIAFSAN